METFAGPETGMNEIQIPRVDGDKLPWLTSRQMREVDRSMVEVRRIGLSRMMENAGRNLARLAMNRFGLHPGTSSVLVLAGHGGNGGGALVAARRLQGWGIRTAVVLSADDDLYTGVTAEQLAILGSQRVPIGTLGEGGIPSIGRDKAEEDTPSLFIDGLIGYSLDGNPVGPAAQLVRFANAANAPVLALDLPSGLHPDSGHPSEPTVKADATLTLALPKVGLRGEPARPHVGELYLADIGVPTRLYDEMSIAVPADLFARSEILRIEI